MRNRKLKHSKVRNTGLLFEFLLRQITADVLNKKNNSKAAYMIKQRFNERTELGKELALYNILINKKFKGGSPLATSKGSTLVTREGLLNQLKQRFGKSVIDKSILSEDVILNDEDSE